MCFATDADITVRKITKCFWISKINMANCRGNRIKTFGNGRLWRMVVNYHKKHI